MKSGTLLLGVLIALGALVEPALAQSDAIVQGQVIAAADGFALPGATVMLQAGAGGEPRQPRGPWLTSTASRVLASQDM